MLPTTGNVFPFTTLSPIILPLVALGRRRDIESMGLVVFDLPSSAGVVTVGVPAMEAWSVAGGVWRWGPGPEM